MAPISLRAVMTPIDAILVKCGAPFPAPGQLIDTIIDVALSHSLSVAAADANVSVDGAELYLYLWLGERRDIGAESLRALAQRAAGLAMRLAGAQDIRGASYGARPAFHYVVETDVAPEAEAELNDWYNTEHLPGLAAVPGTIRARRLMNLDAAPRYHSCYELVDAETFGSPPWLAVRHTAWSDRVRPSFRNAKRTMFKRAAARTF